ncbi:MAG: response regulator, partial [Sulfurisoma sp.]|nr:response regulator [Sulfurisoma sp.]
AYRRGDFTQRMPNDWTGVPGKIADTLNDIIDMADRTVGDFERVSREVGKAGKVSVRMTVSDLQGSWARLVDSSNTLIDDLVTPLNEMARVTNAISTGDLTQRVPTEISGTKLEGRFLKSAETLNGMVDRLSLFAAEVTRVAREVGTDGKLGGQAAVPGVTGTWKDLTDNVNLLAANLTGQVRAIAEVATAVTKGDFTRSVAVEVKGEIAELKDNINEMIRNLRETTDQNAKQDWLKTNLGKFTRALQGQRDLITVSRTVLSELAPLVDAQHGVFYVMDEPADGEASLKMFSSYAYRERKNLAREWKIGEGLVGQCAFEKQRILLTHVPDDYIQITSGLGEAKPLNIVVLPILFEGKLKAVIELASFDRYSVTHLAFLDQLAESIGIVLNIIEATLRTEELLKQSQSMTAELSAQQEELRQTNEELEDKARLLEEQKSEVETKNREVEQAKAAVEEKAEQLSLTSRYKSEFLSNMSHELRTPLNSLLILAQQLAENPQRHLDPKEVEYAKTIHGAGNDLLSLINEILDLSKIESGTVTLDLSAAPFAAVCDQVDRTFRHVAQSRGLAFEIKLARDLPPALVTDEKRLLQVLKNLLSNAFKFTEQGQVTVQVDRASSGWSADNGSLNRAEEVFAFTIEDTGIGIPANQQRIIFEAFQQADGATARKYGGTGLGLSISREIARLLGGELRLAKSVPGQGSVFVLYVPQNILAGAASPPHSPRPQAGEGLGERAVPDQTPRAMRKREVMPDDRAAIQKGDRVLLIVEDDPAFAKILLDLAREKGFKGIVAMRGTQALDLARSHKPDAITLDVHVPDMDGWTLLDLFKRDPDLRHIPVDIITVEGDSLRGFSQGVFRFLTKPVSRDQLGAAMDATAAFLDRPLKTLLLVTARKEEQKEIADLLGNGDITLQNAVGGKAGLAALRKKACDCVVVDAKLADMSGAEFITALRKDERLAGVPAVVYSRAPLDDAERAALEKLATTGGVKSADSPDRLLDQTALFLHRVVSRLPEEKRKRLQQFHLASNTLSGKKVLIVDDDVRNIFALTAALEHRGMVVASVESGRAALDLFEAKPDMDIVLMDIMMPDMDGYETTRAIRKQAKFKKLPIIALTAKAMVGDREKCLEAGASDYLSKPVNIEQLASLMQVWLSR